MTLLSETRKNVMLLKNMDEQNIEQISKSTGNCNDVMEIARTFGANRLVYTAHTVAGSPNPNQNRCQFF